MKKLLSVLLAFILVFTVSASVAEAQRPEETLPDEHTEGTNETDRSFTIPVGVGIVYLASGIVEYLVYVPMLGAGGSYLAFITGNLMKSGFPR